MLGEIRAGRIVAAHYQLERLLGAGGMGVVWRARDLRTDGVVALKLLGTDAKHLGDRLAREAELLAALDHPGIVRYVAQGVAQDVGPYLVMDWLDGVSLDEHLLGGALGVHGTLQLGRRVADALVMAHGRGVIHRDIKPSNVFLRGNRLEEATLIDFGIAWRRGVGPRLTCTGAVMGTPGYMAPEQAAGEGVVDAPADIFSLGCVLFECLTGRPPFVGQHLMALLAKVLLETPPRVRALVPEIPEALDDLVASMLEKDPVARQVRASDVHRVLAGLMATFDGPHVAAQAQPPALTGDERRVLAVLMIRRSSEIDAHRRVISGGGHWKPCETAPRCSGG
jgi:serine/threonine protein kinase